MLFRNVIHERIKEIFKAVQHSTALHQRNSFILTTIYKESDHNLFVPSMLLILKQIIASDYRVKNTYTEKAMDFYSAFLIKINSMYSSLEEESNDDDYVEDPLFLKVFQFLLQTQNNVSDIIRFRSCQFINKILDGLVDVDISDKLCNDIETALLPRMKDSKRVLRLQAVLSLHRLQNPEDNECEIIKHMIIHMRDESPQVRRLCVEKVALTTEVVKEIIPRIRDVDDGVKLAAFKRLSKIPNYLKIADRRTIIRCGYLYNNKNINEFMPELVNSWLEVYGNNVIELMKSLRLDADEKDIEETNLYFGFILHSLFQIKNFNELDSALPLNDQKLIPIEKLNWETVSFWRIYAQFLKNREDFEDELNRILPELVYFCKYITEYQENVVKELSVAEFLEYQYILSELFTITRTYDFDDVVNRQCLNALARRILEKAILTENTIKIIVSNFDETIPDTNSRSKFIGEIISEIMYPMDCEQSTKKNLNTNYEISQLKVKLNRMIDEQQEAIRTENYLLADQLKNEVQIVKESLNNLNNILNEPEEIEKRTDVPTIVKYLDIINGLLLSPRVSKLTPAIQSLKDNVVQELLMHENDTVKAKAFKSYALCCIMDKESARNAIHLFSVPISAYRSGEECDTQILLVCIKAVVDLILLNGSKLMAEPEEDLSESRNEEHLKIFTGGTSLTDLIQGLVDLMDDEVLIDIQETAGKGLCKLILTERVDSSSLISRIILKWCNPANEESVKLKQMIGITLENVPHLSEGSAQLQGAVLLTVKTLFNAPKNSPLSDVNIEDIAKFIIALCSSSADYSQIHENLAMSICFEMKDRPRSKLNYIYSKMLLMLKGINNKIIIRDLLKLCEDICCAVHDKLAVKNVNKFILSLKKTDMSSSESVIEEEVDDVENI